MTDDFSSLLQAQLQDQLLQDQPDHDNLVAVFVQRWGLLEDAQNMLSMMDQASAQKVMVQFSPRDVARDANAVFLKFASSLVAGMPQSQAAPDPDKVASFIERWSLGPEAQELFHGLEPAVQARVLIEFSPRDKEKDANGIFMKFAQGISQGRPRAFKGAFGKGGGAGIVMAGNPFQQQQQFLPSVQQFGPQRFAQAGRPQMQQLAGVIDVASLQAFVLKWSLHEESQALFFALDAAGQMKVMQEFSPRDTSRDCNAIFCRFVQNVASKGAAKGCGGGAGFFTPFRGTGIQAGKGGGFAGGGMVGGGGGGDAATSAARVAFVAQWNLGPDAQHTLFEMTPEQQQSIMLQFSPRDTSSPVDNVFMKFAQGIMRSPGGKGGKGGAMGGARISPYLI